MPIPAKWVTGQKTVARLLVPDFFQKNNREKNGLTDALLTLFKTTRIPF